MKALFCVFVCGAAPVLFGASMFRLDPAHSGIASGAGPKQFHRVKWKFPTGDRVVASPVYTDGSIYFGSDDGNLYSVDAESGRQNWKFTTGGPVPSTPAVSDGLAVVASYDSKLYAVNVKNGRLRWKFVTGGERRFEAKGIHGLQPKNQTIPDPYDVYLSSPVIEGNRVYFGSGDGNLYALDLASGEMLWKFHTGDVIHASPALASGVLYFGSWDSYFYAVDAASGKEVWRFHGGEDPLIHNQVGFQSSPTVVNGVVYTGCRDSNVYALDAATGKEKWRVNNEASWVNVTPTLASGKLLFATSDSSLFRAVDAATGKEVYRQKLKGYVFASPTVAADVVYIGILNGTLEARDLQTGVLLWDFQTEAARQNRNWVLNSDGTFNTALIYHSPWREAGTSAINVQLGIGSFLSTPLVVNGAVYIGSADGNLYAIE